MRRRKESHRFVGVNGCECSVQINLVSPAKIEELRAVVIVEEGKLCVSVTDLFTTFGQVWRSNALVKRTKEVNVSAAQVVEFSFGLCAHDERKKLPIKVRIGTLLGWMS